MKTPMVEVWVAIEPILHRAEVGHGGPVQELIVWLLLFSGFISLAYLLWMIHKKDKRGMGANRKRNP